MELFNGQHPKGMKVIIFPIVKSLIILCLIFCKPLTAQQAKPHTNTWYVKTHASERIVRCRDMHLKGPVQSLCHYAGVSKDTGDFYTFSPDSLLLTSRERGKGRVYYYFDNQGRLRSIFSEQQDGAYTCRESFDLKGYLSFVQKNYNAPHYSPGSVTETYRYNVLHTRVSMRPHYAAADSGMDFLRHVDCQFYLDVQGRLCKERYEAFYKEWRSAKTTTFRYNSLCNRPDHVLIRDDCAMEGGNSCINLSYNYAYDASGYLIAESCQDHTIRNAVWSEGFNYQYRYNANGDLTQSTGSPDTHWPVTEISLAHTDQKYDYEYDAQGNWIRKYELRPTGCMLVEVREISYY